VIAMLDMFSFLLVLLESVTPWDGLMVPTSWLPKVTDDGERLAGGVVPVPVSPTDCGLLKALSVNTRLAVRVPVAVGVNVTLMAQFAPAARVEGMRGQLLVWPKSPGFVPPRAMLEMLNAWLPEFVRVTV
jgi:hypothetical protein